jgi:predicted 2-oxoglutarate/Fe(II)-dependent dioxygenase YbiX
MNEHCDHIKDLFIGEVRGIPILSVLGALNNDYKGGELVFFQDQIVELKQGDLMVFPSVFMYPHRVETVTEGTRYSFVSWAW